MRKIVHAIALATLVSGCATPRQVTITTPFDVEAAARMMLPGPNTIFGSAVVRQRGGGLVTCAGNPVVLIPATAYAKARIQHLYGSNTLKDAGDPVVFTSEHPDYRDFTRSTTCNAAGFFTFEGVSDGEFFVQTNVAWSAGDYAQGGDLIQRAKISGGRKIEITLTPGIRHQ